MFYSVPTAGDAADQFSTDDMLMNFERRLVKPANRGSRRINDPHIEKADGANRMIRQNQRCASRVRTRTPHSRQIRLMPRMTTIVGSRHLFAFDMIDPESGKSLSIKRVFIAVAN